MSAYRDIFIHLTLNRAGQRAPLPVAGDARPAAAIPLPAAAVPVSSGDL
jgi:hypothetical protein